MLIKLYNCNALQNHSLTGEIQHMKTIIIIPARYQSQRFPGKPLAALKGATGISRSLIERSWLAAKAVEEVDAVYVATDNDQIADAVSQFGGDVIMTSPECENGTVRCAEAITKLEGLNVEEDIIINLQGDAPLTPADFVTDIISAMKNNPNIQVGTPVLQCDYEAWYNFTQDRKNGQVGGTTAVFQNDGTALYFSKEVIPYTNQQFKPNDIIPVYHHVGLYGYRISSLQRYLNLRAGVLEQQEGLEQLRFMENGIPVSCVEVQGKKRVFWELNNPIDVERIEAAFLKAGIE